ncbi:tetratricopeptide repeat protein [Actinoplanes couchii]|uniref:Tetratricopeptide TPR_2 repeat protein n=1 Tax=Actinoplanes couchii TaxID=403638 RepID=A0ABQ3XAJ0_9ACTN|nr:tetratricopeptide repeat protein [Actinoplanes couchii]MDR6324850.1 Flp pilus assembly protein TadD [Actinoplanes couchii]GID55528.1 hypothetical protein Aco03nite_039320 [Actinoplanes couchii]
MPAPLEPDTTPEEHRQRALLFADLGRYDEAADEIAAGLTTAPQETALLSTLARIHLAAEQPAEALAAAQRAATADPQALPALVVHAMALVDSRRYADAARIATAILRTWPEDPYAQRTGAALLSESRNGQEALNAAWNGVRVAPTDAEAHLVLAVVAARLRLFDLAQRAYGEALDLDSAIGDASRDTGIVRFERRRWARALEDLAEEASLGAVAPPDPQSSPADPSSSSDSSSADPLSSDSSSADSSGRSDSSGQSPGASVPGSVADPVAVPISRPTRSVLDISDTSAIAVRESAQYGAGGTMIAAVLAAAMTMVSPGISRVWAGLIAVLIFGAVVFWFRSRLPEPVGVVLPRLRSTDRQLATAVYLTFAAPLFLLAYAVVGGPIPLVAGIVVAAAAELLAVLSRRT